MKKVLVLLLSVGIFAFVACGESAEKKAAREKAVADSIMAAAQADSIANAAMMVDSAAAMVDSAAAMVDSAK
mgnify:CR=1 FL=1